ncbi:Hint domain-containing protein [Paracoccus marcusii]|uniref:Hint domain-containing protein n=1 Tax=Paracoccus marcusii TaxID=59779 RepID=UPI00326469F6
MITFSIRGDQLIVDPAVGTNSSQGTATVQWGRQMWAKDHRIEITAIDDTGTELTGRSGITGMKVFDESGRQVAEYRPMNPGQTANIQGDLSGLGDHYARINTSVMQPAAGSPWIGPIMITNGDHSFATLPQTFQVGNGAYDIAPAPQRQAAAPCFGPDVQVDVARAGVIAVRDVRAGDAIMTTDGRQPVLWTGARHCSGKTPQDCPVDLNGELFSPLHRILWRGRWAKARHLAEAGRAVARPDHGPIDYHHILLPVHSVILTARNRVESLLMTPYSLDLWKDAPALRNHASASTRLRYEEWRRGDLLRHERRTGGSGDVRQDHDAHVPAH